MQAPLSAPKRQPPKRSAADPVFSPSFYRPYAQAVETALFMLGSARSRLVRETGEDVRSITYRLKSPASIRGKLLKKGLPVCEPAARAALHDVAGLRVVLPGEKQVYRFAALLRGSPVTRLLDEKDYIAEPKPSGYRSLHLVLGVPVSLRGQSLLVPVELQLRTAAMDMWASIEHDMVYKPDAAQDAGLSLPQDGRGITMRA